MSKSNQGMTIKEFVREWSRRERDKRARQESDRLERLKKAGVKVIK